MSLIPFIVIEKKGFKVTAHGKLGRHPKLAAILKELASEDEIHEILKKVVEEYMNPVRSSPD